MTSDTQALDNGQRAFTLTPALLEAILFAAGEPVRIEDIAAAFGLSVEAAAEVLQELTDSYAQRDAGLTVRRAGDGYRLYTRPELADGVAQFANRARVGRLSRPALETLAIVAYRQPVTRGEIARVRGVSVDSVLRTLQDRGLVDEVGRDPGPGTPPLYGTTPLFLEKIGLSSVADLPPLAAFAPDEAAAAEIERALQARAIAADEPEPSIVDDEEADQEPGEAGSGPRIDG